MKKEYVAPEMWSYSIEVRAAVLTGSDDENDDDDYTTYTGNESNDL